MHVRRALALALVVPLLLAGCTGDEPKPKMPDPPTTSSTPTPTVSETPEAESAEEFVRRWVELSNGMLNGQQVEEYLAVSEECETCVSTAERMQNIVDAGGYARTDGWTLEKVTARSGAKGRKVFDLRVRTAPTVFREGADAKEESFPGGVETYRLRLNASAPWRVLELTVLA